MPCLSLLRDLFIFLCNVRNDFRLVADAKFPAIVLAGIHYRLAYRLSASSMIASLGNVFFIHCLCLRPGSPQAQSSFPVHRSGSLQSLPPYLYYNGIPDICHWAFISLNKSVSRLRSQATSSGIWHHKGLATAQSIDLLLLHLLQFLQIQPLKIFIDRNSTGKTPFNSFAKNFSSISFITF